MLSIGLWTTRQRIGLGYQPFRGWSLLATMGTPRIIVLRTTPNTYVPESTRSLRSPRERNPDMTLASLPSAEQPPTDHAMNKTWRRRHRQATRRKFLRLTVAAGLSTGLAFASLMPTARRATATHRTPANLWSGCYGPNTDPDDSLAPATGCCDCGSRVSSTYCNSEGWHRHHNSGNNRYDLREASCGGKNAWLWTVPQGSVAIRGVWRCSDGKYKICSGSNCPNWSPSVCPKKVGTGGRQRLTYCVVIIPVTLVI